MAIIGGGPGGYEAALVAKQLGADVTVVDSDGIGGSAVLTDCVPSKTLIATAEIMAIGDAAPELGISFPAGDGAGIAVDLAKLNERVVGLAKAQSSDIEGRLVRDGVRVVRGHGRLDGPQRVVASITGGDEEVLKADTVLVATGASPRTLPTAQPDGERILTWEQLYDLHERPEHLVVVGSGVTGAEFAGAYNALGLDVTLVSSRDRVLPGEDPDAAEVIEQVFKRRGMTVLGRSRMASVSRDGDSVTVTLEDGREVIGSHCLLALGSVPNTSGLGLEEAGVQLGDGGYIGVDKVSRTTARGVYAAGDCTGLLMLASVAAMQGRIAMWHALGEAVAPIRLKTVAANVFTHPEIATVGVQEKTIADGQDIDVVRLPLATNARAKMSDLRDGFVKLFTRRSTGVVVGGVVVAPGASELILPIALAVTKGLTAADLAQTFSIYPSLSGSITEAGRRLMGVDELS